MKLIFVRHTQTIANIKKIYSGISNYPLTTSGEEQLLKIEAYFNLMYSNLEFDIYTSPLERCIKLAKILASEYIEEKQIIEYNFGDFDGKSTEELMNLNEFKEWCSDYINYKIPNGENLLECRKRVELFLTRIISKNTNAVIVSHEGIIKLAILILLKLDNNMFWSFKVSNGGIIEIEIKDENICINNIINDI